MLTCLNRGGKLYELTNENRWQEMVLHRWDSISSLEPNPDAPWTTSRCGEKTFTARSNCESSDDEAAGPDDEALLGAPAKKFVVHMRRGKLKKCVN